MKRGVSSSCTQYYDDAPNERNQPQHSPAHSSSKAIPNPPPIDARDMIGLLVPAYLNLPTTQERQQQATDVARRRHARPRPNDGVYQFQTPPLVAANTPRTGPHLTPSARRQLNTSFVSGETDIDVISTGHYHGEQYAESEGEVSSVTPEANVVMGAYGMSGPSTNRSKVKKEDTK